MEILQPEQDRLNKAQAEKDKAEQDRLNKAQAEKDTKRKRRKTKQSKTA